MAHYALLDQQNVVLDVLVIGNDKEPTEADGIAFCEQLTGKTGWIKTSYNATIRSNYAGIGYAYDAGRDAFIPPQPYKSWLLDESSCQWVAPVPCPGDPVKYLWDEQERNWVEIL